MNSKSDSGRSIPQQSNKGTLVDGSSHTDDNNNKAKDINGISSSTSLKPKSDDDETHNKQAIEKLSAQKKATAPLLSDSVQTKAKDNEGKAKKRKKKHKSSSTIKEKDDEQKRSHRHRSEAKTTSANVTNLPLSKQLTVQKQNLSIVTHDRQQTFDLYDDIEPTTSTIQKTNISLEHSPPPIMPTILRNNSRNTQRGPILSHFEQLVPSVIRNNNKLSSSTSVAANYEPNLKKFRVEGQVCIGPQPQPAIADEERKFEEQIALLEANSNNMKWDSSNTSGSDEDKHIEKICKMNHTETISGPIQFKFNRRKSQLLKTSPITASPTSALSTEIKTKTKKHPKSASNADSPNKTSTRHSSSSQSSRNSSPSRTKTKKRKKSVDQQKRKDDKKHHHHEVKKEHDEKNVSKEDQQVDNSTSKEVLLNKEKTSGDHEQKSIVKSESDNKKRPSRSRSPSSSKLSHRHHRRKSSRSSTSSSSTSNSSKSSTTSRSSSYHRRRSSRSTSSSRSRSRSRRTRSSSSNDSSRSRKQRKRSSRHSSHSSRSTRSTYSRRSTRSRTSTSRSSSRSSSRSRSHKKSGENTKRGKGRGRDGRNSRQQRGRGATNARGRDRSNSKDLRLNTRRPPTPVRNGKYNMNLTRNMKKIPVKKNPIPKMEKQNSILSTTNTNTDASKSLVNSLPTNDTPVLNPDNGAMPIIKQETIVLTVTNNQKQLMGKKMKNAVKKQNISSTGGNANKNQTQQLAEFEPMIGPQLPPELERKLSKDHQFTPPDMDALENLEVFKDLQYRAEIHAAKNHGEITEAQAQELIQQLENQKAFVPTLDVSFLPTQSPQQPTPLSAIALGPSPTISMFPIPLQTNTIPSSTSSLIFDQQSSPSSTPSSNDNTSNISYNQPTATTVYTQDGPAIIVPTSTNHHQIQINGQTVLIQSQQPQHSVLMPSTHQPRIFAIRTPQGAIQHVIEYQPTQIVPQPQQTQYIPMIRPNVVQQFQLQQQQQQILQASMAAQHGVCGPILLQNQMGQLVLAHPAQQPAAQAIRLVHVPYLSK